ncbi:MAG: tRNA-uridine aminocarboxypropyltransferase [Acidobacteriota bacterium]
MSSDESCATCGRPATVCVCDRVETFSTRRRVLVLQHPQEQDKLLGSAQLLTACLPDAQIVVGLSWRSLAHALGEDSSGRRELERTWAVLFPDKSASRSRAQRGFSIAGRSGAAVDPATLRGIIALDGSWSQAKTLWWRNPWLARLPRIGLRPDQPSIYGRLRREPSRHHVSTLESVAAVLTASGEDPAIETALRRVFRTMVQRCRDAG